VDPIDPAVEPVRLIVRAGGEEQRVHGLVCEAVAESDAEIQFEVLAVGSRANSMTGVGRGLSALGYRFSKADIDVRCVDGSQLA